MDIKIQSYSILFRPAEHGTFDFVGNVKGCSAALQCSPFMRPYAINKDFQQTLARTACCELTVVGRGERRGMEASRVSEALWESPEEHFLLSLVRSNQDSVLVAFES